MPSPNDHARMIVELLQPCGMDLARRWLAALLVVPQDERESVVEAIEARVVSLYASDPADDEPVSDRRASVMEGKEPDTHNRTKVDTGSVRDQAGLKPASRESSDAGPTKKRAISRK
jgi:hypothetical protein